MPGKLTPGGCGSAWAQWWEERGSKAYTLTVWQGKGDSGCPVGQAHREAAGLGPSERNPDPNRQAEGSLWKSF